MNKRLHFLFITLIFSSFVFSQNNFTNAGGDNLWSNPANWSGAVPNGGTAVVIIKSALVIVDGDYSVKQIKLPGGQPSPTFTDGGGGLLTITGNNNIGSPIQINVNGGHITFDVNVVFDTSQAGATKKFHLNNGNTAFTFGAGYSLTIVDDELTFAAINLNNEVNFNGSILGNGILKFASKINANFGANYDGSNFDGEIHVGGATGNNRVHLTSNVSSNGTFLKANGLLSVVGSGSTIFINGANTLNGDIDLTSDKSAILDINANQSAIGTISMGSGTLNLAVDTAVTSVAFADNSGASWSTGTLQITGAGDNEVSFGIDAGGVTNGQLAQITLGGSNPVINASGQLYNQGAGGNVNSAFNNGGGDNLWSNAANWTNGIPNGDQARVTVSASPLICLLYTSPSPRDLSTSRMPSSA